MVVRYILLSSRFPLIVFVFDPVEEVLHSPLGRLWKSHTLLENNSEALIKPECLCHQEAREPFLAGLKL